MRYPVVTFDEALDYVSKRKAGTLPVESRPEITFREIDSESGDVWDRLEESLSVVNQIWRDNCEEFNSVNRRDTVEGMVIEPFHKGLVDLPPAVLSDRDFWRFLATAELFDFATWRDRKNAQEGVFPGDATYGVSGRAPHPDTISLRMFNRGQISVAAARDDEDPYAIARPLAGDIWKSHILRTSNSQAPLVVRAIIEKIQDPSFDKNRIREFVKHLKRTRSNVLLEVLDGADAIELVEYELAKVPGGDD